MRNGPERDGLVEDPEQSEEPGQGEQSGHVENREQLGQGDEPGQVEEPELLERLLQVSDDDAPAHALVDSEIIRDRDQDPWNAQFYGLTALGELKCPACEFPLPVDDFYESESGDNSGDDVIVDNAFENEGDEHEGGEQDLEENSPDHSAEEVVVMISDGEYHESDFNSEEKDA
ncbi:hypothetical protein F443_08231 [Phytophthora nicotianae P1569]|uniref:Uncharacterized protein n=1 Tax=Phytophthora nicotianae P1569 TaxID=1317065 RepID=V9F7V7_PHYNI|nr:hypothetical protein F443_08231 [Phytophthora nicotianae P1569]